ncbi:MAG: hypothetical protein BMS9Abin26_0055 [Gammaproteobacteria bacterium]|nr:MAG: hypothetical protein BMS9Abin26_0055 [Gammaproteobacteria bacterium]
MSGRYTILYVDDDPSNLKLVEHTLRQRDDIDFFEAINGTAGIAHAVSIHPDLILLDISLPDMDGFEVLHKLRQQEQMRDIPVLALSAHCMPNDVERGRQAGFAEYLSKPFNLKEFLGCLKQYLPVD